MGGHGKFMAIEILQVFLISYLVRREKVDKITGVFIVVLLVIDGRNDSSLKPLSEFGF